MNTAVINIKTDPKVKSEAQQIASDMGLNLSILLNAFLRQFVKTKSVTFSIPHEGYPEFLASEKTEKAIKEAMEQIDQAIDVENIHEFFESL